MSAVTTWKAWYLSFNRIDNSRDEKNKLDHTGRITELDKFPLDLPENSMIGCLIALNSTQ